MATIQAIIENEKKKYLKTIRRVKEDLSKGGVSPHMKDVEINFLAKIG